MTQSRSPRGFTLLEILLVVLIISIMSVLGVNIINSQSIERVILNQAQQFSADLTFVCEKAVLDNQAFGFEFNLEGYQVLRYQQPQWLLVESQAAPQFNAGITVDLLLDGLSQDLDSVTTAKDEPLPHIICQSDGSFNAFELRFISSEQLSNQATDPESAYYALSPESPWLITGAWHQN